MKKYIIFSLLVVLTTLSWAQRGNSKIPALVNNSLAAGRGNQGRGYYMIRVPQKMCIPHDEFREYMKRNNYYLVQASNWAVSSMSKFGSTVKTVVSADFLPDNEIGYYLAGIRTPDAKRGKAYLLLEANSRAMDVVWDGQLSNGYIDGYGSGVAFLGNRQYYLFTGKFHNGIANGNCTITLATAKVTDGGGAGSGVFFPNDTKKTTKTSYMVSDFVNGFAPYSQNNKWGFVDQYANIVVKPTYEKIVSSFNSQGYAVVLNSKKEEIKVDKYGTELGYSDNQLAIYEAERLAAEREAARVAEEKRQAERKAAEKKKYESVKSYYEKIDIASFKTAYNDYMKEYPSDDATHRSELEKMKANIPSIESRIAAGKEFSKWRMGNQVCVSHSGGILLGIVEKFNEDRSAAEVKIISGPSGEYNGQTLKKNGTIWVQQKTGWHLAIEEEVAYASSHSSVTDPSMEPKVIYQETSTSAPSQPSERRCPDCGGRGTVVCYNCNGTGVYSGGWGDDEERCSVCKGSGKYRCSKCYGRGFLR